MEIQLRSQLQHIWATGVEVFGTLKNSSFKLLKIKNVDEEAVVTKLSFNDMDAILDEQDNVKSIQAPKSIERLEEISTERAMQRRFEEDSDDERIQISTQQIDLHDFDELGSIPINHNDSVILDGVEELY